MNEVKHYIACFCILFSVSIYGQNGNENALDNAQREYESGNYERSLNYLNAGTGEAFNNKTLAIKNFWLLSENYIELEYPEEIIIKNLRLIYSIDPLFTKDKYNLEISGGVESRLQTIHIYPKWVLNVAASRDLDVPIVVKEPYICEECIESDNYSYSELGSNLNINLAYFYREKFGIEAGIGYATAYYSRDIKGKSTSNEYLKNDMYSVSYHENLQFIDFPFRFVIRQNKWSFRMGANYKYLIHSDAKLYHTYTDKFEEQITQQYARDDLQKIRNKNLVFLGFNIDRKLFPGKDKSLWYLSFYLSAQVGLNSFISVKNRLSNINSIYETYYTDDKVSLTMLGIGLRINYNAKYKVNL